MGLWSTPFEDAVDLATSENTVSGQQNMESCLEVADYIKGKQVASKEALKYLKKRLTHKNPNVQLLTLNLMDICAKNCGQHFLVELASRDFVNFFGNLIKTDLTIIPDVRMKMIELLQIWGLTFKQRPELGYMTEAYEMFKAEGLMFPSIPKIDTSMLETTTAPEWSDSDNCTRCRVGFTLTNRKHHCRNCGKTFCAACSSQSLPLPEFGINTLVRVCDGCYTTRVTKLRQGITRNHQKGSSDVTDKELELALQLSLEESYNNNNSWKTQQSQEFDDDPMLAAAIAASLKEERKVEEEKPKLYSSISTSSSSANPTTSYSTTAASHPTASLKETPKNDISEMEKENIRLFHQLLSKMNRTNESVYSNQQIQKLYADLTLLSTKIHAHIAQEIVTKNNLELANRKIGESLKKYDWLLEERSKRYHTPVVSQPYFTPNQQHTFQPQQQFQPQSVPQFPQPGAPFQQQQVPSSFQQQQAPFQSGSPPIPFQPMPFTQPNVQRPPPPFEQQRPDQSRLPYQYSPEPNSSQQQQFTPNQPQQFPSSQPQFQPNQQQFQSQQQQGQQQFPPSQQQLQQQQFQPQQQWNQPPAEQKKQEEKPLIEF